MKKLLSTLLICAILLSTNSLGVYTSVGAEELDSDYIELTKNLQVDDIDSSVLNEVNAIVVSDDLKQKDQEILDEVMDNGTGIIIENSNADTLQEYFDVDTITSSKNEMGYFVSKDADETKITPIECNILIDTESKTNVTDEDYSHLLANESLDYNQVISDFNILFTTDRSNNVDDNTLATLQASTSIGSAFMDADKFVYFYKKGSTGGTGMQYTYLEDTSKSGWSQMGSISFLVYAIKIKTVGNTTYDNVFSTTIVTAYNNKSVSLFKNGISVSTPKTAKIRDYTEPEGNANISISGSLGIGVDANGDLAPTYTYTYSYNPNGMDITTTVFSDRVRWTCDPLSYKKNASWKINPGVLIKNTKGKTKKLTVSSYVSYFQIFGGIRTYTIEDPISCKITFKNHKKA